MTSDWRAAARSPRPVRSSATTRRAISGEAGVSSIPNPWRPARRQATSVEPVPTIGSSTIWERLVKNSTNSCASVSGNFAGWRRTPLARVGGLWMNQDFWNLIHSFGSRSLSRLRNGREGVMGLGWAGGGGGPGGGGGGGGG